LNRITAPAIVLLVLAAAVGCVPALREAPEISGSGDGLSRGEAERRYREAVELFATRRDEAVRRASSLLRESAGSLDNPVEAVLALSEVLVWQVEHEPDPDAREDLATRAVHAGQWCLDSSPEDPRCSYRLAIAVGVQARERPGTGVDAMPLMIELLETARAAEPGLDHGGPDRVLALLYLRAPGWPAGPGDPDLGYEHALAAAGIDREYPPNQLVLGEALAAVDRRDEAIRAYREALRLSEVQQEYGGRDAREWLHESEAALSRFGS
jgi:tetratricopeptide (TPR) repeat protein